MSTLTDIAEKLEGFAETAFDTAEKDVIAAAEALAPVLEDTFETVVAQFGSLAVTTVMNLFGAAGAGFSGTEKANLSDTTILQAAKEQGVTLLAQDVTALVKNAYVAVNAKLASIGA